MYKHITDWAARPLPSHRPSPPPPTHSRPKPAQIEGPLPRTDSQPEKNDRGSVVGSLSSTPEPSTGEPQDEPVCPAAFTVVWLMWASWWGWWWWGGTDPRGQRWAGSHVLMNVFLSLDIGHFTISSQKKIDYTDISFFIIIIFVLCSFTRVPLF